MPFYDVREAVYMDDNTGHRHNNNSIGEANNIPMYRMGDHLIMNDT